MKRSRASGFKSFEDYVASQALKDNAILSLVLNKLLPNQNHNVNENKFNPDQLNTMITVLEKLKAIGSNGNSKQVEASYQVTDSEVPGTQGDVSKQGGTSE